LGFSQKPPGGSILTARRRISGELLFLFWHEPPGGDEFLPGGATLLAFCLMVLMLFVWESMWLLKFICLAFIGYFVGRKSIEIWGMATF